MHTEARGSYRPVARYAGTTSLALVAATKRAGLAVTRFVAPTNANDVVPAYLATGRYEPRASVRTVANAMDVGHPSNFARMLWLYDGNLDAMRRDITGAAFTDDQVRETIRRVYESCGYLLDPHSAIGYMGLRDQADQAGIFLATAHPAKFSEIVEPIIGHPVTKPEALAQALGRPRHIIRIDAAVDAVKAVLRD